MKITTKDLITIIPFEDDIRADLLAQYDSLSGERKYLIDKMLWDAYDALYELKLQENMQRAFIEAKEGKQKLDPEFYKRVKQKTEEEMTKVDVLKVEQTDLDAARKAMEQIVSEIQAAKKKK